MNSRASFLLFLFILPVAYGGLEDGFYATSCPRAEMIIREVVENRFQSDPSITPALLRMQFHDCFVRVSPSIKLSSSCLFFAFVTTDLKSAL